MIDKNRAKQYCCEDISKIENYDKAIADKTQTWHLHHRRGIDENKSAEQLIEEGLYTDRPAIELIFQTPSEHRRLHNRGKHHSAETIKKMSTAASAAYRGMHWWNNGQINKRAKECPGAEWQKGRLFSDEAHEKINKAVSAAETSAKKREAMKKYWAQKKALIATASS